MLSDPLLERLVALLVHEHGCQTIILYGSRAKGEATIDSDYDLLGIRPDGDELHDARLVDGVFLDAFIKSEKSIQQGALAFLHLRGGITLLDPSGQGARLLSDVAHALDLPPPEVPASELHARRNWCKKMLARISRSADVEANYRRHWLLVELLELYFVLRRRHYLGSKESFRWLAQYDETAHRAFSAALHPGADLADIERLAHIVLT